MKDDLTFRDYGLYVMVTLLPMVLLFGCAEKEEGRGASSSKDRTPVVSVSHYPLQYFVQRLVPWVEVQFPAQDADDPAYWIPGAAEITTMQQADLVILNGASYEGWLTHATLLPTKLVDTSAPLADRLIHLGEHVTHSHGLEGEHEHSGVAFTVWLDFSLAQVQVQALSHALAQTWPLRRIEIEQAAKTLTSELDALDTLLKTTVSKSADLPVLFSHPVYQYMEKRYGMNGRSVHWEPDSMPDDAMWKELEVLLESHPAKWMIWEGKPLLDIVTKLTEIGIQSVVFDPCAGRPDQGDLMSVMKQNVAGLTKLYDLP